MRFSLRLSPLRDAAILLLWGVGILLLASSGSLASFLHPALRPFTVAGGITLVLLTWFSFIRAFARHVLPGCSCSHDHAGHSHEIGEDHGHAPHLGHEGHAHAVHSGTVSLLMKSAILLLPILSAVATGRGGYTATVVNNRGVVGDLAALPSAKASSSESSRAGVGGEARSASGAMPIQVIDLLYAVQMPSYREEFEGKQVEMVAQYVPMTTGNPKGDRFQAVRMFITCCAADAKPLGVTVRAESIPKVPEMGWVRITGTPTFPMEGGKRTSLLEAAKVEACEGPRDPFVY
jgi:uncharacterized repeat protein (TIGR03943 family)